MGHGPGRPVKPHGPPHGPGGAAHVEPTFHGPRPGPAHQVSREWVTARPGPSIFQMMGRVPARPIKISEDAPRPDPASQFQISTARPGPSKLQKFRPGFKSLGPARPRQSQISDRPGPTRPGPDNRLMTSPAHFYGKRLHYFPRAAQLAATLPQLCLDRAGHWLAASNQLIVYELRQ